jgi:NAD(P)-dependent dehydrogenase (short-subunit alcohol dehydrogenase family)
MLADRGWHVALLGRRGDLLEETIKTARTRTAKLVAYPCDVSEEPALVEVAKRIKQELGLVEALVNSAGTNVKQRTLDVLTPDSFRELINVNLTGAFLCVHQFLPMMREKGAGTIVNIISDAGLLANPKAGSAYISSKFGLRGLTQAINVEQRANGIRACAIFPGDINTPLLDKRPVPPPQEARLKMLQSDDVAKCVLLAIELPPTAIIEELLLKPA